MEYRFLDRGDDELIAGSQLPLEGGVAVALRSTGYEPGEDEAVEVAVVGSGGEELFHRVVKPQNVEEWQPGTASGGLGPADVADAPELYQFEDDLAALFQDVPVVVAEHLAFAKATIEASWVSLPDFPEFDLVERFRASHSAADYPGEPAAAAALSGIADYYGVEADLSDALGEARAAAACYREYVREHERERQAKGEQYWARREARLAEEAARNEGASAAARKREKNLNRMNGLLWVCAALIFTSLVIQLHQNGGDTGFMVVAGAFAVFALVRAVSNFRK